MNAFPQLALSILGQSVLILAIASGGALVARRPATRAAILRYAFAGVLAISVIRVVAPGLSNPWLQNSSKAPVVRAVSPTPFITAPVVLDTRVQDIAPLKMNKLPAATSMSSVSVSHEKPFDAASLIPILFVVWLAGTLVLAARMLLGLIWLKKLRESAKPVAYSRAGENVQRLSERFTKRPIRVVETSRIGSPLVAGVWSPTVFMPLCQSSEFEAGEIEAMLSHEFAHVDHNDNAWSYLAQIVVALMWPNPFAWIASNQMSNAAEELCDSAVLENGVQPSIYAQCLLRIAEKKAFRGRAVGLGMFSSGAKLSKRIARVFDERRVRQASLSSKGHYQIASASGVLAIVSCLAVPAHRPDPKPSHAVAHDSITHGSAGEFLPSKREEDAVRKSDLPYIPGDFTLTYDVRSKDIQTDEEREAAKERAYADNVARLNDDVKNGRMTRIDADDRIKRRDFGYSKPVTEHEITVSCRNGVILYKDSDGASVLLTKDKQYTAWNKESGMADNLYYALNTSLMPLPAAGFSHFPLSQTVIADPGESVKIPDSPVFGVMVQRRPWDGKLISDLARDPAIATFKGEGDNRRLVALTSDPSAPEYEFQAFTSLKGVQIASQYTRFWQKTRYDYSLVGISPTALPEEQFEPGVFFKGRNIEMAYMGKNLRFKADLQGSDLEIQLKQAVAKSDAEALKRKKQDEEWAKVAAAPGGAPDIYPLYADAQRRAARDGKALLAIMTCTTCPPCVQLQKLMLDPAVRPIVEAHFEVLWIDCGEQVVKKRFENKNGSKLCDKLGIATGFPTYAALDPSGKVLERQAGCPDSAKDAHDFFLVMNAAPKPLSDSEKLVLLQYLSAGRH